MKFFGFACVATSLIALKHVQAATGTTGQTVTVENTMQSGALCTGSNTDAALAPKQVYLNYPGVGTKEQDKTYFIRITKEGDDNPIAEFDVTNTTMIENGGLFKLALEDAQEGKYSMQSCQKDTTTDAKTCSPKSTPAKEIKFVNAAKMDCARHDSAINQITLKKIDQFYSKMEDLKKMPGTYANFHGFTAAKEYKKLGMEQTYSLYAAFEYDLTQFKQFYQSKVDYCKRKYHLTVLIHLVDQQTKEVKRQFKFSPKPLTPAGEAAFVLADQAPKAPLEVLVKTADTEKIPAATYKLWTTVCVVEKDFGFDASEKSVACAEPHVSDWKFE